MKSEDISYQFAYRIYHFVVGGATPARHLPLQSGQQMFPWFPLLPECLHGLADLEDRREGEGVIVSTRGLEAVHGVGPGLLMCIEGLQVDHHWFLRVAYNDPL